MIGELIKERRLRRGLSQVELARRVGSSQRQISRWENGSDTMLPRRDTLDRLGAALDITIAEFYRAAGVLEEADPAIATAPRTVTITVRGVEETHDLAEVIAYVEAKPERRHQEDLSEWKRTMDPEDYAALLVDIYSAWTSNSTAIRSATARMWHRD